MAHYDIFRGHLASKYPTYGHSLWEPSPPSLHSPVEIGDVGFVREGRFIRLFNALLSADHPSHQFGVPEYHEPLVLKLSGHVIRGMLSPGYYCSTGIDVVAAEIDLQALGPDYCTQVSFFCKGGGAVLALPTPTQRQDTLAREAFGKWMVAHIDRWFAFARNLELGIEQTEELILVTGCDRARSWTNVAFLKNQLDAQASFGVEVTHGPESRIDWRFAPERVLGAVLNQGPSGTNLPENQCIFIRGFRVARTFAILPRHLRAAAKPSSLPDTDTYDRDSGLDMKPISIPTVSKYQDPLHFLLGYLAGRAPGCDMVLVHDDDLARISESCDYNALKTLRPDAVETYLQGSNMEISTDLCSLSHSPNTDPQTVRVGKFMMTSHDSMTDLSRKLSLASLASRNVDLHHIGECLAINRRSPQRDKDDPLDSLPRADMNEHKYSSRSTTPMYRTAAATVNAPQTSQLMSLLSLPPELITRILLHLSPFDVISCGRTCRILYDLCNDSALRYLVQMERCSVSDDMSPGISYPKRLRLLEEREDAWGMLDFHKSVQQVSVPFASTGFYDLVGGVFFLSTRLDSASGPVSMGCSSLNLPSLSNAQHHKLEWKEFSFETEMLNFAPAVREHDLIAVLMVKKDLYHPSDTTAILQLQLSSFSMGRPHPLAEQPVIFIATKSLPLGNPTVLIEVVGDFVILMVAFLEEWNENENMFFLVRWKEGEAHCLCSPERGTYIDFTFLSEDTLVMPNLRDNTVEITKIVIDSDDTPRLVPLCVFHLPPLTHGSSIDFLACYAKPNPTGSGPVAIPSTSGRPFRDKAEDAIIIFDISYQLFGDAWTTFIVHRRALLAHIPAAYRASAPFCPVTDPTPAQVRVPWSSWGPAATRWFEGDHTSAVSVWVMRTAGQRAVTLENRMPTPIIVRDFNVYAVRAARALMVASGQSHHGNWSKRLPNGNRMTLNVEDTLLAAGSVFKEDVRSSLPYVEIVTQNEYHYSSVMIDDERVMGSECSTESEVDMSFFDVHVLG